MFSKVEVINLLNTSVQYIDLSDMPVSQKIVLKKKLKTELTHVRTRIESIGEVYDRLLVNEFPGEDHIILKEACSSDKNQDMMSRKRKFPEVSKQHKDAGNISYNEEDFVVEKSEAVSTVTGAFEGDSPGRLDNQNEKGRKMDISKIKQCGNVLRTLMNHQFGWVFNQPVDPVVLCIPDYFSVIKKPMDLGTVKDKLERKRYSSTHQFAADVRLTFSNAMRYNPPRNDVHMLAKDLNNIFNAKWKSLEFRWRMESPLSSQQSVRKIRKKQAVASDQVLKRIPSCNTSALSSKSLNTADKLKIQNRLENFSGRNMPPPLFKFLQKTGLLEQCDDRINLDVDELDEATLWELHQIISSCGDAGPAKPAGLARNSQDLMKASSKGTGGTRDTSGFTNSRVRTIPSACINSNHPCGTDCPCDHLNNFTQASFSDGDSDRSSCGQNLPSQSTASDLDGENISGVQGHNGSSDTIGRIGTAIVDFDSAQHASYPSGPADASPMKESEFPCESHLSPSRALRAAMLKSRFADTILKAQHRTLLDHGEKSDPAKMQREKERLEKKRQNEKARIEAQIRAAEAAVRMKAEAERKMQREREREAARLALQKMKKTVDIDENSQISKELENLGYPQPVHLDLPEDMAVNFMDVVEQQAALANPLAQLGLFMKEDDLEEEVDNWISSTGDSYVEEGEIGSS